MTRKTHPPRPGEIPEGRAGVRVQAMGPCAEAHSKAAAGNGRYMPLFVSLTENPIDLLKKGFELRFGTQRRKPEEPFHRREAVGQGFSLLD